MQADFFCLFLMDLTPRLDVETAIYTIYSRSLAAACSSLHTFFHRKCLLSSVLLMLLLLCVIFSHEASDEIFMLAGKHTR